MSEMRIGDFIRSKRIHSGFPTQKMFADQTGVSPATLSRIEKNLQKPTPETLMLFSQHLQNVTYAELMKITGYLGGQLENSSLNSLYVSELELLDRDIYNRVDRLADLVIADSALQHQLVQIMVSASVADLYQAADLAAIKHAYMSRNLSIDEKRTVLNQLDNLLSQYSPQLGIYLKSVKHPKPIPLVGSICAGNGMIASEEIEAYISYPFPAQPQPDFALRVQGDSMIHAGILDQDIVFMKKASWPEYNGQIVAVIINGEEGTLKRMRWSEDSSRFTLAPENDAYDPFELTPNEFIVCGTYVGHFRQV